MTQLIEVLTDQWLVKSHLLCVLLEEQTWKQNQVLQILTYVQARDIKLLKVTPLPKSIDGQVSPAPLGRKESDILLHSRFDKFHHNKQNVRNITAWYFWILDVRYPLPYPPPSDLFLGLQIPL